MDLVNVGRSRRFLRERPIRVTLFDRPRLVCDLICLETEQTEKRRGLNTSDSFYLVIEGKARLRSGQQVEEMEEQDAALIPPGVDHTIENLGPGRLTVMVIVTPKPSRAGEVRMPAQGGFRPVEDDEPPGGRPSSEETDARPPEERPRRPYNRDAGRAPPRGRPYTRDTSSGPARTPYRRDGAGPSRGSPPRGRGGPGDRRDAPSRGSGPRREVASDSPRGGRRDSGEGPAWFPRPKQPSSRPRGAPPAAGRGGPRGGASGPPRPTRARSDRDERESLPDETPRRRGGFNGPPPPGASRGRPPTAGRGRPSGPPRGRAAPGNRGAGGRGASGPARRPTGRPAPGRSGPRTSGPRRSPE
jgi:Cupin domain